MKFQGQDWTVDLWEGGSPKWVHVNFHNQVATLQWWEAAAMGRALIVAAKESRRLTHLEEARRDLSHG